MSKAFRRQDSTRFVKIGSNKTKKTWRRPRGTHSKMRRQRRSYPASPKVGRRVPSSIAGKINNMTPIVISNMKDLSKTTKESLVIIASTMNILTIILSSKKWVSRA